MSKKQTGVALLLILFCSLALRVSYNFDRSMRFDEAFSMIMVTEFSWSEMMDRIAQDVHPPLYYVLLRLWINLGGNSELTSRLMSVLFGVMTVFATYLFGRDAFLMQSSQKETARITGLIAAIFVSVASFQIHWSQEIRMYSLGTALAMLSSWALIRALQNNAKKWWFWYVLFASALIYTHNYALFTVASQAGYCLIFLIKDYGKNSRLPEIPYRLRTGLIFSFGAIALVYLLWLPILWNQYSQVRKSYWIAELTPWTVSDSFYIIFFPSIPNPLPSHFESILIAISVIALIIFLCKKKHSGMLLIAYLIIGPIILSVSLSLVATPIVYQRYFIFSQLFILCGIAFVLTSFRNKIFVTLLSILVAVNLLFTHLIFTSSYSNTTRFGTRGVSSHILANFKKGDMVLVSDSYIFPAIKYYTKTKVQAKIHVVKSQLKNFSGKPILTKEDFNISSMLSIAKPQNIWLVGLSRNVDPVFSGIPELDFGGYRYEEQLAFTQNWSNQTREVVVTQYTLVGVNN